MEYSVIGRVEGFDEKDLSVKLVLNERRTDNQGAWTPICWRTVYPNTNNQNRRFYIHNGSIWHIPIKLTLELMDRATSKGLLRMQYDDKYLRFGGGKPSFNQYSLKKNKKQFSEILTYADPNWAVDTIFVIAEEPKSLWRKVMIASKKDDKVTFRSLTRDKSYNLKQKLKNNPDWFLDRSMMDCDTAVMRKFRDTLKLYFAN